MTPSAAKASWKREWRESRILNGKYLRPLKKYRQAKNLQDYFDQRVSVGANKNSCWKFDTAGDKDGYSQCTGSKHCAELGLTRAHQVSYYLFNGFIPENKLVCHTCDNPWCVNPNHLFVGTPNDNVQDMMKKGRYIHPTQKRNYIDPSSGKAKRT